MKKPNEIVYMEFGSKVYGTSVPESDTDYKGIELPSRRDIVLQRAFKSRNTSTGTDFSRNTKDDVDQEIFALHQFMKLLSEGQTGALDMVFTPNHKIIRKSDTWDYIVANKSKILSKKMTSFAGYCKGQSAKYSLKGDHMEAYKAASEFFASLNPHYQVGEVVLDELIAVNPKLITIVMLLHKTDGKMHPYLQVGPKTKVPGTASCKLAASIFKEQFDKYGARAQAAMDNKGIDRKALYHAVRICNEGIELCETGNITFPRPEADYLLKIRSGEIEYQEIAEKIDNGLILLTEAKEKSTLPDEPNQNWIENFIYETYLEEIKCDR